MYGFECTQKLMPNTSFRKLSDLRPNRFALVGMAYKAPVTQWCRLLLRRGSFCCVCI